MTQIDVSAIAAIAHAANEKAKKPRASKAKADSATPAVKRASQKVREAATQAVKQMGGKLGKGAAKPTGKTVRKASPKSDTALKASAAAADAVKFITRTAQPGKTVHVLSEETRPVSGKKLYAHTHAALTILGMLGGGAAPKKAVLTVMGQRAVSYHLAQGNFESAPDHGIRLSTLGANFFKNRFIEGKVDVQTANAYTTLFLDGTIDDVLGVNAGNVYEAGLM